MSRQFATNVTTIYDIFCPVPFLPSPFGFRRFFEEVRVFKALLPPKPLPRRPPKHGKLAANKCALGSAPQLKLFRKTQEGSAIFKPIRMCIPKGPKIEKFLQSRLKFSITLAKFNRARKCQSRSSEFPTKKGVW